MLNNNDLKLTNYEVDPSGVELLNDGTTLLMRPSYPNAELTPRLEGGPLIPHFEYRLDHLIFHWGENDTVGAEHLIDGKK